MAEQLLPFHSFTFTLVADRRPRAMLRMAVQEGESEMYELHVERGSASNPSSQFTRSVPLDVAVRLRDVMQESGVYSWEESYGDASAPGTRRWNLNVVFKKDVFTVTSRGGSDAPAGFDLLLEELYRLDFPRPEASASSASADKRGGGLGAALNSMGSLGFGGVGGMSAGDLGAYGAMGKGGPGDFDFSQLSELASSGELSSLFADMKADPQAMQRRLKEEFRHMSPDEQSRMLDLLASTGMGSRAWWERFLRGE